MVVKQGDDWQRLGVADSDFERIVRQTLASAELWQKHPQKRIQYFASLLGHQDSQINQLAHLELGQAPYDQIKKFGGVLPREKLYAFLSNFRYIEWHA